MNQKRFLTADEVFQLFGVNSEALDELVESGAVKALKDLGSYKYRAEDFAALVKEGKLTPRTAGEMFQLDAQGEMPFLKIRRDEPSSKFDDDVSFIELDEEALEEQAQLDKPSQTPVVPEKWFDESDDSLELTTTTPSNEHQTSDDEETDFDFDAGPAPKSKTGSDSNVRFIDDEAGIDLDEPHLEYSPSDSDVRLEGPVSSPISPHPSPRKSSVSDSDVRLVRAIPDEAPSDSDVRISPVSGKPDSDSDVTLATPAAGGVAVTADDKGTGHTDSDVVLMETPAEAGGSSKSSGSKSDSDVVLVAPAAAAAKKTDSDSDVRIAGTWNEPSDAAPPAIEQGNAFLESIYSPASTESDVLDDFEPTSSTTHDSGIRFESGDSGVQLEHIDFGMLEDYSPGDSGIRLEEDDDSGIALEDSGLKLDPSKTESEIPVMTDSGLALAAKAESGITLDSARTDSEIAIVPEGGESGISLEPESGDSGITLQGAKTDSEIAIVPEKDDSGLAVAAADPDSGISLEADHVDSGITLEAAKTDSEIAIEPSDDNDGMTWETDAVDSGIALGGSGMESGISLSADRTDSELDIGPDSGISLEDSGFESGLSLDVAKTDSEIASGILSGDSGISLDFDPADSGLAIEGDSSLSSTKFGVADSGIRLGEPDDSGLSFESDDAAATLAEIDSRKAGSTDYSQTQTLEVPDSSESIGDHTIEMNFEDSEEELSDTTATIVNKGRTKSLSLSEAFKLDEPLEVEDLDISEDLDSVPESEYNEEFAEAEEEVLEASDDDFSASGISAVDDSEDAESEASVPAVKVRALPKEPSWGLLAVIPIGMASLAMAATVVVLWGGVATMWTGAEPPGPAAALISTLAGLL